MRYDSFAQLLELAEERQVPLWHIILVGEMELSEMTEAQVFARLESRYAVMVSSATRALEEPLPTVGGLIEGVSSQQNAHAATGGIAGGLINTLMARALSCSEVNASMGKICAAPTAGACGIIPAVLMTVGERYDSSQREILEALLTASGVGGVIMENATVAGAEGGCQAECGVAAAMGAAAAVYLAGGTNAMCLHAVSIALMNVLGLVCDPVAGLVQVPCAQRNASQAVNAVLSADLALGGMESIIPTDQMVEAMFRVGKMLPDALRETARGGIAATPAAKAIARRELAPAGAGCQETRDAKGIAPNIPR